MAKIPDLRQVFDPPDEIIQAGLDGELVMFVGSGVSMLLGLPSWKGLAGDVFKDLRKRGFLNFSEIQQLSALEPKKQLSIAKLIADDNGYALNLENYFRDIDEKDSIYESLNSIGCTCVTTNYDELLAPRFTESKDGSETAAPVARISETEKFFAKLLDQPGTVIHLHGAKSKPETMIVTTKEYLEHYDDDNVQTFLGELFAKKTVLFIGYGLDETEILEHILRRGSAKSTTSRRRFALQGFFSSEQPLYENLHHYYEKSFGVHLLGFTRDHDDYACQAGIIARWVEKIEVRKPPLATDADFLDEVLSGD